MKRIFVQMVSFRDTECHHTLTDMFEKAAHPERISVGLCWQLNKKYDMAMLAVPYPRADQVQVVQYDVSEAKGAGWARNEAQKFWNGEEYILQIQSHMRFEKDWDKILIDMLEGLPSPKAVLTAWLPNYMPPDGKPDLQGKLLMPVINRLGSARDTQIVHMTRQSRPQSQVHAPFKTGMWVGNFMFCRAEILQEVPFDPYIYFWGEEINYSARLWTHGVDIYHLDRVVLYHQWDRPRESAYRDETAPNNSLSFIRNKHLLGIATTNDPKALQEIERYGLGDKRSLADYFDYLGVDIKRGIISANARAGVYGNSQRPRIFVAIPSYRDPELTPTIHDLFDKAAFSQRVTAGVCEQLADNQDEDCRLTVPPGRDVRIISVKASDSKGANWARAEAMKQYQGEEYILMVDSHMRFEEGWDEILIEMLARTPTSPAVISGYLPNYTPPDTRDSSPGHLLRLSIRRLGDRHDPQLVHLTGVFVPQADPQAKLYRTPFLAANFIFAPANLLRQVPIDPHIYFHGDEINLSTRFWTHGIDIYQPDCVVAYHYWARYDQLEKHQYRKTKSDEAQRSRVRNLHLLDLEKSTNKKALIELEDFPLGTLRSLESFWAFTGINLHTGAIAGEAKKGIWQSISNVTTVTNPAPVTRTSAKSRIFVQIASYRDPDCQHTVKDLFDKATHPERIFVGICWQFIKEEDDICFQVPYPYPKQVRVHEVDALQGRGVCWARNLTQKLWQGEEFTLQIDSHMRFEKGWDDTLLAMYEKCDREKSVLTCYPPGFEPHKPLKRDFIFGMSGKEFDKDEIFKMAGIPAYRRNELPAQPIKGAFASACMLFGPSSIIADVPYDPYLYFFGEEITLAVRLWTNGYDLYHPNDWVLFHDWDRDKRPTHFQDHDKSWWNMNLRSVARVRHLLGTKETTDTAVLENLNQYGLGTERTLAEYERYSGVDFAHTTFTKHAANWQNKDKILVTIASYRDPECQWTVKDLFEKAAHPERINVVICWQFDEKEDADCFNITTRPDQVQVIPYDWRESEGVSWARAQTEMLFEDETYVLQIDSHMRFEHGWDELMIAELASCDSKKPVLSSSPAKYIPPNQLDSDKRPTVRRVLPFNPQGNIRGRGEYLSTEPPTPLRGAFIAAGYMFSKADRLREVPYDPYLYFDQEEIVYAMRLFTHGWDVYSPKSQYIYHYYNDAPQSVRPLHWKDLEKYSRDKLDFFRSRGLARFNHISEYQPSYDARVIIDLDKYGLGNSRSLAEFESFCGIDFKQKIAHENALTCGFIPELLQYRSAPIGTATAPITLHAQQEGCMAANNMSYEVGDILPYFILNDSDGHKREMAMLAGKPVLLCFLGNINIDWCQKFFAAFQPAQDATCVFVTDSPAADIKKMAAAQGISYNFLCDAGKLVQRGITGGEKPVAFLLAENLQVKKRYDISDAGIAPEVTAEVNAAMSAWNEARKSVAIVSEGAPVLMIPEVLSRELCAELIDIFEKGHKSQGKVGNQEVKLDSKIREDMITPEPLRKRLDEKFARNLFPEIEKVFGFKVAARENYKIGLYDGENGGFFSKHRDNFREEMGYRRIALTLHLSDDYEGGGVLFPEYDQRIYRPSAGSIVAFPCSITHEARKVTKGKRYILVGFFHGEEEERFRLDYHKAHHLPLQDAEFKLEMSSPSFAQSRDFLRHWQQKEKQKITQPIIQAKPEIILETAATFKRTPAFAVGKSKHQPIKIYESRAAVIYDNFLPPDMYEKIRMDTIMLDYDRINVQGKISRAWHIHDGFPLRSSNNSFYNSVPDQYSENNKKPHYIYPTGDVFDPFMEYIAEFQPQVEYYTGKPTEGWKQFSATAWLYPPGTSLAMHDDGSGVYTGAYAFFLNETWRSHWGGMLLVMDDECNAAIHAHREKAGQMDFYKQKWLHANKSDDIMLEHGLARCVFPKGNRIVFISNDAYHMVTKVTESAGDNIRVSLAGFFSRKKS